MTKKKRRVRRYEARRITNKHWKYSTAIPGWTCRGFILHAVPYGLTGVYVKWCLKRAEYSRRYAGRVVAVRNRHSPPPFARAEMLAGFGKTVTL